MNTRDNVAEFRRLEKEIEDLEQDNDERRWRQAELAYEACDVGGTPHREYAEKVGKSYRTVGNYAKVWARFMVGKRTSQPRFADALATIETSSDVLITAADRAKQKRERQIPSDPKDKVKMAEALLRDKAVAKAVAKGVGAPDALARHNMQAAIDEANGKAQAAAKRRLENERAEPKARVARQIIAKCNEYARDIEAMLDSELLPDEVPAKLREPVAEAFYRLTSAASAAHGQMVGKGRLRSVR